MMRSEADALATVRRWSGPTERGIRVEPVMVASDLQRAESLEELADHLAADRLITRIADTYPIDRTQEAHARLKAGGVRGRLVLTF